MAASNTSMAALGVPQTKVSVSPVNTSSKLNAMASCGTSDASAPMQTLMVDNRKNDTLFLTKSQKDISGRSKKNTGLDEVKRGLVQPLIDRSELICRARSKHLHRCLNKVMWNIQQAWKQPLRTKRPALPKRLLPPVPDLDRVAKGPCAKGNIEPVKWVVRARPSTFYARDRLIIREQAVEVLQVNSVRSREKMDLVFGCDKAFYGGTQQELYEEILHLPLLHALDGFSALVMLCGQKGTGKTYTSRGEDKNYDYRGLIPRVLEELFRQIQLRSHEYDIRVSVSYYDLVGQTILDLLAEKSLTLMTECSYRHMTYVKELSYARITNEDQALFLYLMANYKRQRMRANFKKKPIESHTFFTLYFEIHSRLLTEEVLKVSKLTLLELASVTNLKHVPRIIPAMHDILLETNKSVGLLEKTISLRLTADMPINKIPCRQSKLVYALKDILTDQRAKITIVACISSERLKLKETISSLKFASRFKGLQVVPRASAFPDHKAMLKKAIEQTDALKMELRMYDLLNTGQSQDYVWHSGAQDVSGTVRQVKDFMDDRISLPKFSTYRELENFLSLLKKLAKDAHLTTEAVQMADNIPAFNNLQVTINEAEDGKITFAKDFLQTDGIGELDDKYGLGVGMASGARLKNLKNLTKKRKDERTLNTENSSLPEAKKSGMTITKKAEKNGSANSPLSLKGHLSDLGQSADSTLVGKDAATVEDRVLPPTAETSGINKNIAKSVSLGTTTPATGSLLGGAPLKLLTKAIPKSEAYLIFSTKTANGMEPFRETETKRQTVTAKEKAQVALAVAINGWIDQLSMAQCLLDNLSEDQAKTRPQTVPVLTFGEEKTANKIKHLRYLIETGYRDFQTCQADLTGLREYLADSRKNLLSSFEKWYAITYEENSCEPEPGPWSQLSGLANVPRHEVCQAVGTSIGPLGTLAGALPTVLSPFTSSTKSEHAPLLDAINDSSDAEPKETLEGDRRQLQPLADNNCQADLFYRVRDQVRKIIRAREENEAYHRIYPNHPARKLEPEMEIHSLLVDLPSALHRVPQTLENCH